VDLRTKDRLSSLLGLVFAILFCIASFKLSLGTFYKAGPGLFPFLAGAALGLLSLINLLNATIRRSTVEKVASRRSEIDWKAIVLTVALLSAYPLLLHLIGFAAATFFFFVFLLRFIQPKSWTIVLGGAGLVTAISYLLFQYWLKIKFPVGFWGI